MGFYKRAAEPFRVSKDLKCVTLPPPQSPLEEEMLPKPTSTKSSALLGLRPMGRRWPWWRRSSPGRTWRRLLLLALRSLALSHLEVPQLLLLPLLLVVLLLLQLPLLLLLLPRRRVRRKMMTWALDSSTNSRAILRSQLDKLCHPQVVPCCLK